MEYTHLMYCPFTGLGSYNGFRGNDWLKNRIQIFKQFVVPSLQAQTSQNFIVWISWRREERYNRLVIELQKYTDMLPFRVVHTFSGVCFYDDKYPDDIAKERLTTALHGALQTLVNVIGGGDVLMTIQPSDDCYRKTAVADIQKAFKENDLEAVGFAKGYICNYLTKEVAQYNPTTNPPFYTIRFRKEVFMEPIRHALYTALKENVGKYKAGTPCPSHEYVPHCLKYGVEKEERGFLVGVHGVNISTSWQIPFRGVPCDNSVLSDFGLDSVSPLVVPFSVRGWLLGHLPHRVSRKLRYWNIL